MAINEADACGPPPSVVALRATLCSAAHDSVTCAHNAYQGISTTANHALVVCNATFDGLEAARAASGKRWAFPSRDRRYSNVADMCKRAELLDASWK